MTSSRESSSDDSTFQFEQDRERKREKRRNKKIKWKPTPEEEIRPQLEETHRVIDPYRDLTSRFHVKAKLDAVTKCRNWLDAQDFDIDDVDLQSSRDVTKKLRDSKGSTQIPPITALKAHTSHQRSSRLDDVSTSQKHREAVDELLDELRGRRFRGRRGAPRPTARCFCADDEGAISDDVIPYKPKIRFLKTREVNKASNEAGCNRCQLIGYQQRLPGRPTTGKWIYARKHRPGHFLSTRRNPVNASWDVIQAIKVLEVNGEAYTSKILNLMRNTFGWTEMTLQELKAILKHMKYRKAVASRVKQGVVIYSTKKGKFVFEECHRGCQHRYNRDAQVAKREFYITKRRQQPSIMTQLRSSNLKTFEKFREDDSCLF